MTLFLVLPSHVARAEVVKIASTSAIILVAAEKVDQVATRVVNGAMAAVSRAANASKETGLAGYTLLQPGSKLLGCRA